MKKPLSYFRTLERQNIAKLNGMKSIMRVTTPRTYQWWLVLPAIGNKDSLCIKIDSMERKAEFKGGRYEQTHISGRENIILREYADRITA
jgi:hypothetical protein